jgi:CheY-like chemotaxis protein
MAKDGKIVLIVDDSVAQASALKWLLEQEGLQVLHAPNGRIGVEMAQQHLPDAIVLDIEMPEMDGFEACRHLKENPQTADIPIVILTVHGDRAGMVLKGIDLGAIDFIPKDPFSYTVILETLRQLNIMDNIPAAEEDNAKDEV